MSSATGPDTAAPLAPQVAPRRVAALRRRILRWYGEHRRDLPWRHTSDPYAVLVSEMMLQQTQVARVVTRYGTWLAKWPTLESLADAPLADVLQEWQGLGYNNRARRLRDCATRVVASAQSGPAGLPRTVAGLTSLPGIGPYTARAVLIFAHNDDLAAVDANVRRVLTHELELPPDLGVAALQAVADAVLPRGRSRDWHNALMDYGSLVLTGRATGIAPRARQSAFEGSRRQRRARLLREVLARGTASAADLADALGLAGGEIDDLAAALARDGLLRRDGDLFSVV